MNVILLEPRTRATDSRAEVFLWLVYSKELPCQSVMAADPWEAVAKVAEGTERPLTFTSVYPVDDSIVWLDEWNNPPERIAGN